MVRVNKKNGKMKIQQMSFMIIAVFLFLAMVGMMVITVKMSDLKSSATALEEQNAMLLVTKLANSPEFSCGDVYGTARTDCIDEDKLMALKANIDKYSNFWGVTSIQVLRIYPPKANPLIRDVECTSTNYPKCNLIKVMSGSSDFDKSNYVALCRKERYKDQFVNRCEIARLIVGYKKVT
jgi:hypothetical protein